MPNPSVPSPDDVLRYLEQWQRLENYRLQEQSLSLLFKDFCPANVQIEHVLLKVSALNDFYSTRILNPYAVAKHIHRLDIDARLNVGDLSLVNELALVTFGEKRINFYSFASKYCSHHFPVRFPIFDSYVVKMLMYYRRADAFSKFRLADLKNYERFVGIIREFQEHYGLCQFSLRQIDIFLWLAGKESFPRVYNGATKSTGQ